MKSLRPTINQRLGLRIEQHRLKKCGAVGSVRKSMRAQLCHWRKLPQQVAMEIFMDSWWRNGEKKTAGCILKMAQILFPEVNRAMIQEDFHNITRPKRARHVVTSCANVWSPGARFPAHVSWIWIVMGSKDHGFDAILSLPSPHVESCGHIWNGSIHGFRAVLWKYSPEYTQHQLGSGPDVATSAWAMLEISSGPRYWVHWWFHDLAIG